MINKETLEKHKLELIQILDQKRAEVNIVAGAIQDCDYWLAELNKEE